MNICTKLFLSRAIRRLSLPHCGNSRHLSSTSNMNQQQQQDQPQLKSDNLKPEISPEAQKQQQEGGVPPAKPTGSLQDMDPNKLMAKRNQVQNWCSYRSSAGMHIASLHDQHPVKLFVHLLMTARMHYVICASPAQPQRTNAIHAHPPGWPPLSPVHARNQHSLHGRCATTLKCMLLSTL